MSKEIQFKKDAKNIVITIPIGVLKWACEHHPESPLIVKDENVFAEKVMFELQHNLGSMESGLSGFQELLDEAMLEVAESGDECVDLVETEW
jgi:uncharacterized protein YjbK